METIAPPPCASRCGTAASMSRTSGIRSPSRLFCHWSGALEAPAETLETTMSSPPSSCADRSTKAARAAGSVTSTGSACTVAPCSRRPAATLSRASAPRAHSASAQPSSARVSAIARPMPRLPPVTRARLPVSSRSMGPPLSVRSGVRGRVEADEHLADVVAAEHAEEGVHRVREIVDDGALGDQLAAAQPAGYPALELRPQVLVVADDEPAQRDPLEHRLDEVVDARPGTVGVELRDHPAERDPAAQPQGVQRRDEVVAADVVEVQVDPLRRDPGQAVAHRLGAVVDRAVEAELLDQQGGLARSPGAAHHRGGAEQPGELDRRRADGAGRGRDEDDVAVAQLTG